MKVKLKECDIVNLVRGLLTEEERPALGNKFIGLEVKLMVTVYPERGGEHLPNEVITAIDIGPYYCLPVQYGERSLTLIDKDLVAANYDGRVSVDGDAESIIRDLYNEGKYFLTEREDFDKKKKQQQAIESKYKKFIQSKIAESTGILFYDDVRVRHVYFLFDDNNKIFLGAYAPVDGILNPGVYVYENFGDYFHLDKENPMELMFIKNCFKEVLGAKIVFITSPTRSDREFNEWTVLEKTTGEELLKKMQPALGAELF